jgi:hypothetical protein
MVWIGPTYVLFSWNKSILLHRTKRESNGLFLVFLDYRKHGLFFTARKNQSKINLFSIAKDRPPNINLFSVARHGLLKIMCYF